MDPVEAGDWLSGRPQQLVYLTGLDPANRPQHANLVALLKNRNPEKPPLNLKVINGELDLPGKRDKCVAKGILRREWPNKYLNHVPALIAVFLDLDWHHESWAEKRAEAESKIASIRASCKPATKVVIVLLQQRTTPTTADDNVAEERAHEMCHACSINLKQLFILPILGDLNIYITRLESDFHELAQAFYQQKFKAIRARSIPNNAPALVVRQQFKLAFISELRQDTHTALRNYRLAYDQCRDSIDQWDPVDIFEWRSVAGLLNYKMCELSFLHSTAMEAIGQMRKHQTVLFNTSAGNYPSPQLASIELLLWKAKQCWHFAQLFEQAVSGGLAAVATLNPGTQLDQAASIYSQANQEILAWKNSAINILPYPSPDPLANSTVFFGQRPWRVGYDGLAPSEVEANAINAITQRLVVNYEGVVALQTAAMNQYRRYGCIRMQKKVMAEMANVHYVSGDTQKAIQLWCLVARDAILPATLRKEILHKTAWAAYALSSVKDYVWCCLQLMAASTAQQLPSQCEQSFHELISARPPSPPFANEVSQELLASYRRQWQNTLIERQFFSLQGSRLDSFLSVQATFLSAKTAQVNSTVPIRLALVSTARRPIVISGLELTITSTVKGESELLETIRIPAITIKPKDSTTKMMKLAIRDLQQGTLLNITKITVEFGEKNSVIFGQLEFDESCINRGIPAHELAGTDCVRIEGLKSAVCLEQSEPINCLISEVASTKLQIENVSANIVKNLRLEFKRNDQTFAEASAVLFVDAGELKSEFAVGIESIMQAGQKLTIPVQFSAQLVGTFDIQLELSYELETGKLETTKLSIPVKSTEPFTVKSGVLSMSGLPMIALLNHCEHVLNVEVTAAAKILISSVEFLVPDVVKLCDTDNGGSGKDIEDEVDEGDVVSYCAVVSVSTVEEDVETPLGRLAVEWRRFGTSATPVRTVVPLCRIPVLACPISLHASVLTPTPTVRQPINICFEITSHLNQVIGLSVEFELGDMMMFSGDKKKTITVLPNSTRKIPVTVMALSAGRLIFPKIILRSSHVDEASLQHALRTLPATIFVLVRF